MWDLGIWIWLVLVMQWRRCPYDSLFDFVRFGFLVFCSCTFHICIFPRPQTAHSANICKQLCGCVSCAHPCVHVRAYEYERLISYVFWTERKECKTRHRAQNCRMCRISNECSEKKANHDFFPFRFVCGFCFLVLKLNSHVKKPRVAGKNITNEVENPTVSDNIALN